jgi:recombination protein RecA
MAEESKSLTEILKRISKDQGAEVAKIGVEDLTQYGTLSLGSPGLDFCIYNSFPERKITEICGAESSGKTTLAYLICSSFQKQEIKKHPKDPRKILYVDLECGVDPDWAKKSGYDMNNDPVKTICYRPEDQPAEIIFDDILEMIRSGEVGMVVIDSLSMLVTEQVHDESMEKKEFGGIAKVLGDFVKRVTSLLIKYDCTLIGINQLRENISGYGNPLITSGGRGWKHGCSLRLMIKKGKFFDEDGNELTNSAESPAGYIMECAVLKSKVCPWDRKLGRTCISYTRGVDILQDTIDVATYFGFIKNPVPGTFLLTDPDSDEVLKDKDGNDLKIRGKKNLKPYFEEHLDMWHKIYDKIYDKISQKDDPNIVSFEKMLNVNVGEAFGVDFTEEEK